MPSKTTRQDAATDKAEDLLASASAAATAVKEKATPVAERVVDHLGDAAAAVADSAAPQVAKAKEAVKNAADNAAPQVAKVKAAAQDAADAAAPQVAKLKDATTDAAGSVQDAVAPAVERVQEAGLTKDQATHLFTEEWLPRIQAAVDSAATSTQQAYAALPQQARDAVEAAVPAVAAKKRRRKGKVLIALGLLAGVGAVALFVSGRKKAAVVTVDDRSLPVVERADAAGAEAAQGDLVGAAEAKVDDALSDAGARRGRHAAGS
ncbi:hypothetical protein [Flexivirga caeni]|uniref:Uncharacterized protein n=1 Tax=Flexivirga caeni TaxID=2294115 RepID=A0A3M9M3A1_9MICO|nr:hypothetical protein [Flexivirga caeni]RNI19677.1 hypothetical protein EFY87_16440 [Flexivirga caeni]